MSAYTPAKFSVCILHSCDFIVLTKSIHNQQINTARHLKHFAMMTHADTAGNNQGSWGSLLMWASATDKIRLSTEGNQFPFWQKEEEPINQSDDLSNDWPEGLRPFSSHVVSIFDTGLMLHSSYQRNCLSRVRSQVFSMWKRTSACVSSASLANYLKQSRWSVWNENQDA